MWSKFYLNQIIITGVIAQKHPKLGPIWSSTQKSRGIRKVKSRTVSIQKLKLADPQTMEECGCYRLCENLCWIFGRAPGGNFGPFWAQKMIFFINYIRILRFIWNLGLVLFDSPKDLVSGIILVFGNVLCFSGVNWAQMWTKTVNVGYGPFPLKDIILKDCSYNEFTLR